MGSGQQCCYRENGNLVKGEPSGGSVDITSPNVNYNRHLINDVIPYLSCCKGQTGSTNCDVYYQRRPSGNEMGYILPIPGTFTVLNYIEFMHYLSSTVKCVNCKLKKKARTNTLRSMMKIQVWSDTFTKLTTSLYIINRETE